jgi:hypothetical protein
MFAAESHWPCSIRATAAAVRLLHKFGAQRRELRTTRFRREADLRAEAPASSTGGLWPKRSSMALWSEATRDFAKENSAARPSGRRARGPRHARLSRAGVGVARFMSRSDIADAKLSSSVERSDRNKRKGRPATDGLFFQGRIVPTEVRKSHQNFLAKILRGGESQCQGIFPE